MIKRRVVAKKPTVTDEDKNPIITEPNTDIKPETSVTEVTVSEEKLKVAPRRSRSATAATPRSRTTTAKPAVKNEVKPEAASQQAISTNADTTEIMKDSDKEKEKKVKEKEKKDKAKKKEKAKKEKQKAKDKEKKQKAKKKKAEKAKKQKDKAKAKKKEKAKKKSKSNKKK